MNGPGAHAPRPVLGRGDGIRAVEHRHGSSNEALRAWRRAEVRRLQVPDYCLLFNRTLEGIARVRPTDLGAMLGVKGVGRKVVERFGATILARVRGSGPLPHRP